MLFGAILGILPQVAECAEWKEVAPMPEGRWFHAAGVGSDGRIYAYGGYVWTDTNPREYGRDHHSLVIYDPSLDSWQRGPTAPPYKSRGRRWGRGKERLPDGSRNPEQKWIEMVGDELPSHELLSGQADPLGHPHWHVAPGWLFFDPTSETWNQLPGPIQVRRRDWTRASGESRFFWDGTVPRFRRLLATTATSPDGKIYVSAGIGQLFDPPPDKRAEQRPELLASLEVYDARDGTWSEKAPMKHARQLHAAAVGRDGKLYVFGGVATKGSTAQREGESWESFMARGDRGQRAAATSLASVEIYDPKTDTWSEGRPMPRPRQSMGAALGADGRIYVVGGAPSYSDPVQMDAVDIYDPASNTWQAGPPLLYARNGHAVVGTPDGKIYAIGGAARPANQSVFGRALGVVQRVNPRATVEVLETKPGD